jgi:Tol biopolymer transport system component
MAWRANRPAAPVPPLRAVTLTTFPGQELYPSLSPDGNHVAFTWTGPKQDNADVYIQQIGVGTPLRLTTAASSDYNPVWSPDGRWIAFLRGTPGMPFARSVREVRLIPPLGGSERKLVDVRVQEVTVNPVFLAWCPDSTCLIVTDTAGEGRPDALFVVSLDTAEKRRLTEPRAPVLADTNPALAPDGASLLFIRRATWAFGEPYVVPLRADMTAAAEARRVAVPGLRVEHATWLPGGDEILVSTPVLSGGANLWRLPAGGGQPARLPFVGEDGMMPALSRPQASGSARLAYVRSVTDENIWRIDTPAPGVSAPSAPTMAIASTRQDLHPQLSPDGRRVAFTSTRSGAWEIWISDPDGQNPVQLTSLNAPTGTGVPHWSPDGSQIVFASDAEGQFEVFAVPSAGGRPRNITSHPAIEHVPRFSRDGKWIYFSSARTGQFDLWKVPVSGGDAVQVTREGGWLSEESPDGAYLYFTATAAIGSTTALWRAPVSGGPPIKVLDAMLNTNFAVLERGIYHIDEPSGLARLRFHDFARRTATTVVPDLGPGAQIGGIAVSADGRSVFFARRDSAVDDLMLVENFR